MIIQHMARDLMLSPSYLNNLARTASHRYKSYPVDKRSGGTRTIHHPAKELKVAQRWIHENILADLPVHNAAFAYKKGVNIKSHAQMHANNNYLLRMDFRNFFETLTDDDIRHHLRANQSDLPDSWGEDDLENLIKFVCRKEKLTIGAVTSPACSNTLCYDLDLKLFQHCEQRGITYTRYADDLFFSTQESGLLFDLESWIHEAVDQLACPANLHINEEKTIHTSRKHRRCVTGLVLTPEGDLSIGRDKKRAVRTLIYKWEELPAEKKSWLRGFLTYCRSVEPDFVDRLCMKYGAEKVERIMEGTQQ